MPICFCLHVCLHALFTHYKCRPQQKQTLLHPYRNLFFLCLYCLNCIVSNSRCTCRLNKHYSDSDSYTASVVSKSKLNYCCPQFLLRSEVLRLYRQIMKTLRHMPNEMDRQQLMSWARHDFRKNRHETDEVWNDSIYLFSHKTTIKLAHDYNVYAHHHHCNFIMCKSNKLI